MENLDLSIDEAKARVWMQDVNAELQAVRALLKKVNTANTTVAGSDDTIMQGVYKVGTAMESAWSKMCNIFDQVQDNIVKSVEKIAGTVAGVLDDADLVRKKVEQ